MIENRGPVVPAMPLDRERDELDVAVRLVANGSATRVVVAGLAHVPELIARMSKRAALAGAQVQPLPADPARAVLVTRRPVVLP